MAFHEILSAEQPCILCGQALLILTVYVDEGEERVRREPVPHDDRACLTFLSLRNEEWPYRAERGF